MTDKPTVTAERFDDMKRIPAEALSAVKAALTQALVRLPGTMQAMADGAEKGNVGAAKMHWEICRDVVGFLARLPQDKSVQEAVLLDMLRLEAVEEIAELRKRLDEALGKAPTSQTALPEPDRSAPHDGAEPPAQSPQ